MFKNTSSFAFYRVTVMLLAASSLVATAPFDDVTLLEQDNNINKTSRRFWNTGIGNDLWADSCDFPGYDIGNVYLANDVTQCGKKCYDFISPQRGWCTHFTMIFTSSSSGWCLFKSIPTGMFENVANGMICGFIPGRSAQSTSA